MPEAAVLSEFKRLIVGHPIRPIWPITNASLVSPDSRAVIGPAVVVAYGHRGGSKGLILADSGSLNLCDLLSITSDRRRQHRGRVAALTSAFPYWHLDRVEMALGSSSCSCGQSAWDS